MTNNEILIIRALNNAQRHLHNDSKVNAKTAYDKAVAIYENNSNDVSCEVWKKIDWLKDNYYPKPTFKNCYASQGQRDYEGAILAREGH